MEGIANNRQRRGNAPGMPWIKCLGGGGGKARRGKPLSVSQPIHLLVKVRFLSKSFPQDFLVVNLVTNRVDIRSESFLPRDFLESRSFKNNFFQL